MRSKKEAPVSSDSKPGQVEPQKAGPPAGGTFLPLPDKCKTVIPLVEDQILFSQGESGDSVFYIRKGRSSSQSLPKPAGKQPSPCSALEILSGRSVAAGHALRLATASAIADSEVLRVEKNDMIRALRKTGLFLIFSVLFFSSAAFASRQTWSINSSIPAKNA